MKAVHRFIISGGGTGGHIFPAIAIANALKEREPQSDVLFIGAEGRMEMEKVPAAGYQIIGLPIRGFDRKNILRNISTLFLLWKSMRKARKLIRKYNPDAVIGVGGYASGPTLKVAAKMGIPTILQEQNSYAGVTNKLLASKAACCCVAYEGMERFFPKDKIILTGNPIRQNLQLDPEKTDEAYQYFHLEKSKKTLLVIGGSLGARTINQSILGQLDKLQQAGVQVIWQTGKYYFEQMKAATDGNVSPNMIVTDFIAHMDYAYAIADVVISRAGASSISELCLLGKTSILVPSPNVAEDHQTHNAMALVNKDAAIMIRDADAPQSLVDEAIKLLNDTDRCKTLSTHCAAMAQHNSAKRIAEEIFKHIPA
ncbi:undecaprenyldiphospho-muramoylpentapeptide beta-N-acetylglucosaminyltransferase [Microbacter margulisiae]|uniref:UDP-N-acetylglucosamine--N-acetylmuramyl-(pentapeptide) pyrophosphoryl-undecaprenol N-acetylglucosamine transferase n=1 Tax=Microbacter margulisiae TaxID=1350067 RepID=A0A7W5DQX2_9PORP|nr:undecaprenyldiphospho-muramoylpentapeptide beta-N-acetylglucosaminyltransferase [Microbacter margulisiae]MBB3187437.1 UDP-N-acetylglucosamine--N-acetylmuramyl-(pentapeptide) pyrophosphoryl-undecaprenol N-acetylglucosamine transferase [Microbacter margulisiae]